MTSHMGIDYPVASPAIPALVGWSRWSSTRVADLIEDLPRALG
jgi:hypothetical protein